MSKPKNVRSLDEIALIIQGLERKNIFEIGDRLLEAKDQCQHGEWLDWLNDNFEMSEDTAERKMGVAKLGSKFRRLRNLQLGATTLYKLADLADDEVNDGEMTAIVEELAKHATEARLVPVDALRVISMGLGRHHFGDHPDATLSVLERLKVRQRGQPWYDAVVAALQEQNPETDEDASRTIQSARAAFLAAEASEAEEATDDADADDDEPSPEALAEAKAKGEQWDLAMRQAWLAEHPDEPLPEHLCELDNPVPGQEAWCEEAKRHVDKWLRYFVGLEEKPPSPEATPEGEAAAILDGPPPVPPAPESSEEPQKFGLTSDWETGSFAPSVNELLRLTTKPAERFAGTFTRDDLEKVADFLMAVANVTKTEAAE
jgi:hypothetical protein